VWVSLGDDAEVRLDLLLKGVVALVVVNEGVLVAEVVLAEQGFKL